MKYKLSELCVKITDGSHYSPQASNEGYPMFSVKDMEEYGFSYANCKKISQQDFAVMEKNGCVPIKGDVLVAKDGSYLKQIFVCKEHKQEAILSSIAIFRPNPEIISSDFLCYLLKSPNVYNFIANNCVSGSALPRIVLKSFKDVEMDVPNITTQRKIAAVLKSLDDKIELNNKINENLEQQAQAIFKSWFVDFEPFGGKDVFQYVPLSELCEVVTKGTTPTTLGKAFVDSGITFIKAESILDNHSIDSNKVAYIDQETNNLLRRSVIKNLDILFTIAGTLGRFALVNDDILPANTNQAVGIIRANKNKVSPYYLYSFFIGNWHNDYYAKHVQQAVQANLSLGTIKSLPIAILENDYMSKYLSLVTPIFTMIKHNQRANKKLAELRDSLLPKLMSGEIDVSNVKI